MDWIRVLFSRVVALFRGGKLDADLDEELRAHLELATEENLRRGLSREDARRTALCEFGGVTQIKERYRSERGIGWMEALGQDLRFAARMLCKSPGFTTIVVLTLALGIGGNTAIFSIVNGVLLNPLPFPHPDQLVALHESKPNFQNGSISYSNFLDWRKDNRTFAGMALERAYSLSMTGRGDAEQLDAEFLSDGYFAVLGVRPILGREFTPGDEQLGSAPVAMIGEGLWRRKFDASPNVLGQPVTLDGKNFSIIGVIPATLKLRVSNFRVSDIYAPIPQWNNTLLMNRGAGLGFHGIGRLKPGVTIEQARADMDKVTRDLANAYPDADSGIGASLRPLKEQMVAEAKPFLLILLGAVGFVLLIACVNVGGLLLARSASRSREFAVRTALGATRARISRQLLTESLLLSSASGALGLALALWGTRAALRILPAALPRADEVGVDLRVLAFTVAVSILTGILFGMAPVFKSSKVDPQVELKRTARGTTSSHHRALGTFVVIEMAIALVLLAGAGLMIRSLVGLWNVDPGFNAHGVLNFGLSMPPIVNTAPPARLRAMLRDLDRKFSAVRGIESVSQTWGAIPMGGEDDIVFWRDDQPKPADDQHMSWTLDYIVEPDYLRVMQIPLRRGRFFTLQDDERSPLVAVVDDVFARKFFPGQDPVGRRIDVTNPVRKVEIVGVVGHVMQWGLDSDDAQPLRAQLYLACMQMPDSYISSSPTGTNLIVRYDGELSSVLGAIRRASREMSVDQVIYGDQTMESMISDSLAARRFAMVLLGAFAALALVLACVGIYGVMAYLVSQRTQEVGIRMALGAGRLAVLRMVLGNGAKLAVAGAVLGTASALLFTRLMRGLLFNVSPNDPLILASSAALLVIVAVAACIVPARRAASIDPMSALRTE